MADKARTGVVPDVLAIRPGMLRFSKGRVMTFRAMATTTGDSGVPAKQTSDRASLSMSRTEMQTFGTSARAGHDSSGFYKRKMYADGTRPDTLGEAAESSAESINVIHNHSSADMHELATNSVHLMVTSPPYNVGKDYDNDLGQDEYLQLLRSVWEEVFRVLVPGGRACINIANIGRKPYIPLNAKISGQMNDIGFLMRGEIIWDKSASSGSSCAWGSWRSPSNPVLRDAHEYILVFSKDRFDRPSRNGDATISRDDFLESTRSIWRFPAESARRVKHPAPFPVELPRRLIELYTFSDDLVLDPFMGSGSAAVAAVRSGRRYVGYDTSPDYVEAAMERVRNCTEQGRA